MTSPSTTTPARSPARRVTRLRCPGPAPRSSPALCGLSAQGSLHEGRVAQLHRLRARPGARRGEGRLARRGVARHLSKAPPDGRAHDLLARREGEPAPALSRRRAERGLGAPARRDVGPAQARRARADETRRELGARDDVMGPRERPKEGTTPVGQRPRPARPDLPPQLRLFGAGLPPRTRGNATPRRAGCEERCSTAP